MMIARLGGNDLASYAQAQRAAFGRFADQRPDFDLDAGVPFALGVLDGDDLIAKLAAYPMTLELGGRKLAAHGIADVTVDVVHRGKGVARGLLAELLRQERDRGVAVSVLYPSVPAVYRSYGYAAVTVRDLVRLDAAGLVRCRVADDLSVHRVAGDDLARAYVAVTAGCEGVLSPLPPARASQIDLAVRRADGDVGLLRYERTPSVVAVDFLLARDPDAWQACLALLATETGELTIDVWSSPHDPGWHWYPYLPRVIARTTPMLRVLDVVAAFEGRGWPADASGAWEFVVEDRLLPENSGGYRLVLDKGHAQVRRDNAITAPAQPVADVAALLAGARQCADPHWAPLPDDLVRVAALRDWTVAVGF